jgi:hypothetical protein
MGRACSTNGEKRISNRTVVGKQKERDHWKDEIVLIGWIWLEIGTSGELL